MATVKYNNFLEINPTFESVVDIDADKRNTNLWREYIVGKDMEDLVDYLCQSLGNEAPDARRSFWIHGTYGTGKSYAAIFVKHLLEEKPEVIDSFLASSSRLAKYRNRFARCRKNGDYLVVWKTGCLGMRTGDMMLLEAEKAIREALIEKYGDKADLGSASLLDAVKERLQDPSINWDYLLKTTVLGDDYGSVEELRQKVNEGNLSAMQMTASVIRQKGYGLISNLDTFKAWVADVIDSNGLSKSGIFFIWDEFTEYVANSDDHTVMQQISEFCKEKPLFMLYVVHRSQEMLSSMGNERYQLITDRFHQVEFHVSADAAFDLIAGSINSRVGMYEKWADERKAVIDRIHPFLPDMSGIDDKISEQIANLCPMHPMTIRLLSRVAETYAHSQRTMFRFMKDQKNPDLGFAGYINKFGPNDQECWLTPDWLWDYFFTRESDFNDKDTKAAEYIQHYEETRELVESNEDALRLFKIALLLLAVMSSTKGVYGGVRTQGGISATVDCLKNCVAGVISKGMVDDLLETMQECKILVLDEAANGVMRLQLPFRGGSTDDFNLRLSNNEKKYTRYQMFSKDGAIAPAFEKMAADENDAMHKRMKYCVCCAETLSITNRLEEVTKELERFPYKLGVLIVTVRDAAQYMAVQSDLRARVVKADQPRLTIALVRTPFGDDKRTAWLKATTKQEMANERGQTGASAQARVEAQTIIQTWISEATGGGKIIAWNGTQEFSNLYGTANLRKTIQTNVLKKLFPYSPETIVLTNTAYKTCTDPAPTAGITRETNNSQLKSVLDGLKYAGLLGLKTIDSMIDAHGNEAAVSISKLASLIHSEMQSGQRVVLGDLWDKLQKEPFGYYNTIACGVLLGFVFSCYKDSAFSWTDNSQGTHVLGEATIKTIVLQMCKGSLTTDYLSAGSITFQNFRSYAQKILNLTPVQIANETECWHNMREAVTKAGAPLWALKYLPANMYGSEDARQAAYKIVDNLQQFILLDNERETVMSNVIQLFSGRGKLMIALSKAFQDKHLMSTAFRTFIFDASPNLKATAEGLSISPEELSDKLHLVMQNAIYTWTEDQVKEKLADVESEYRYLVALNETLGKKFHTIEDVRRELSNLFRFMRVPMAAVERMKKPWYSALEILYKVSRNGTMHLSADERVQDISILNQYGKTALGYLSDMKPVLAEMLEDTQLEYTKDELTAIYAGLKDLNSDSSISQFDRELKSQTNRIAQARNRIRLKEKWTLLTGKDTVKQWCVEYGTPIFWVVPKEYHETLRTLIQVQTETFASDQQVLKAINELDTLDASILIDKERIFEAFIETVGTEYREIIEENRMAVLTKAKMRIGNDMSGWVASDVVVLQRMLKTIQQEKAKKEKLQGAISTVQKMDQDNLRTRVATFLENHPEFCDEFI